MRARPLLAAILAAVAVVAVASAQTGRTARLALVGQTPLVVAGTGFTPGERVTLAVITVSVSGPRVRVRVGAKGSFRARLATFTRPCGEPYVITARGAAGSIAVLPLQARPCAPRADG